MLCCKLEKCIARFTSRAVCCCNMLYKGELVECILRATYNTAGNTCDNIFQLPTQHCRGTMQENIARIAWQVNTFLPVFAFRRFNFSYYNFSLSSITWSQHFIFLCTDTFPVSLFSFKTNIFLILSNFCFHT